eukprot:TRINITY_DN3702_c0_g1_i1.p2 TRINITY_DN3702_c0_g1~~TRINITY_DN3702_c0_g1_i1.p2  ORF type:complete len:138 (-),score=25.64 TRINITY_DN3702_c0_g1_i1:1058-1471(-)
MSDPSEQLKITDIDPITGDVFKKKAYKRYYKRYQKLEKQRIREEEEKKAEDERIAVAKKIVIEEDPDLPPAIKIRVKDMKNHDGERIKISGWAHRVRRQGKAIFVLLRDGTGLVDSILQCVLADNLSQVLRRYITPS